MNEIRWKQRFQNFDKAYGLLHSALNDKDYQTLSELEQEGVIQRFEYTFELAWKTLKDYLLFSGVSLEKITPRETIKQGFAAGVIEDGQCWIDMLEHRNQMSHTYNRDVFEQAIKAINDRYLQALDQVYTLLKKKSQDSWTLD